MVAQAALYGQTLQLGGGLGINGQRPQPQAPTPTTLADMIAILQSVGLAA
jgi:hypothetical protein